MWSRQVPASCFTFFQESLKSLTSHVSRGLMTPSHWNMTKVSQSHSSDIKFGKHFLAFLFDSLSWILFCETCRLPWYSLRTSLHSLHAHIHGNWQETLSWTLAIWPSVMPHLISTDLTFIGFSRLIFNEDSRDDSTPLSGSLTGTAQLVKNWPAMQEPPVQFLAQEGPWRRHRLPTPLFLGFPSQSAVKESACNVGDLGSIPGLGRSPGEGNGYPLQYSGLKNPMDCIIREVKRHDWATFTFSLYFPPHFYRSHFHSLLTPYFQWGFKEWLNPIIR